jgi:phosphoglycolate phosphatase
MTDNFIFDLDGTIINSSEEVLFCLDKTFKNLNLTYDKTKLNLGIIGPPLAYMMNILRPELIADNMTDIAVKEFNRIYDNKDEDRSFIYKGMYEVLAELKNRKKKLFIATNKFIPPTIRLIKKFNLNMFEDFYTIDKLPNTTSKSDMINDILQKYNLNPDKTIMIGDTVFDVKAAKNSNIIAGGVLWGYGNDKTDLKEFSDIIFENPYDILKI